MPKRFTLVEAQRLIPQVDELLRNAIALKAEYDEAETGMQTITERVMLMGGMVVDRSSALEMRNRRDSSAGRLRAVIEQVQELGCLVKDLDTGLIDFPTLFRGEEVYMCWRLGETAIAFWHGVDEGFRGRKAIDQDFKDNHKGERSQ